MDECLQQLEESNECQDRILAHRVRLQLIVERLAVESLPSSRPMESPEITAEMSSLYRKDLLSQFQQLKMGLLIDPSTDSKLCSRTK